MQATHGRAPASQPRWLHRHSEARLQAAWCILAIRGVAWKRPAEQGYSNIFKVRVPRSRGCFCHSIKLGFGVRVISKAKISLGCSLVLLEMNDEFRLSNTLFDINF